MKRMVLVFTLLILSFSLENPGQAQDEQSPLLEMLRYMPQSIDEDTPLLAYTDIELALSTWVEIPDIHSTEDFDALSEIQHSVYWGALPITLPTVFNNLMYLRTLSETTEATGLDFFSVKQSLVLIGTSFQEPYIALRGDFDTETIINRHMEEGYSQTGDDWTILCPEESCTAGFGNRRMNFETAILLKENLLMEVTNSRYLLASQDVISGSAASRFELPDYAASANLLSASGAVSQAIFVDPEYIASINEVMESDSSDMLSLPSYGLVTIAELVFAEDEETQVHIILSYETLEEAETAAENLEENLNQPDVFNQSLWESLNADFDDIRVVEDSDNRRFLVQAILSSPFQEAFYRTHLNSSSLFRFIYATLLRYLDADWLRVEEE